MHPDELFDVVAETSIENLREMHADFEQGALASARHVHGFLALFRQLGACRLFTSGMPEDTFVAQQQAASGYLFRLPTLEPDDLATSAAGELWDAIGGEYWDAAQSIAQASRATWNPNREHEEDFLYVYFLMQRFLLEGSAEVQEGLLVRWVEVIEDELSPQLDLCRGLLDAQPDDVLDALERMGDARAAEVARKIDAGVYGPQLAAWLRPYWNEGLALIRLLGREGIEVPPALPQVPDVLRVPCPFRFDPGAWRHIEYRPMLR